MAQDKTKISEKRIAVKKHKKLAPIPQKPDKGWMVCGFDVSMSSLAGAAIAYDVITKRFKGPKFVMRRFSKDDEYLSRIEMAARSHELIFDLQNELVIPLPLNKIYIAQEEPFPPHSSFMKSEAGGQYMKQQAEMSGAFLGGLLKYGYKEIWQMSNMDWRGTVANELGITTHHSKWKDPSLPKPGWTSGFNARPADYGKFRAKQWAIAHNHGLDGWGTWDEIPDWPDIIESKDGKVPRPEGSKAKAIQPDDRYDSLAIMWTLYLDMKLRGQL